MFQVNGVDTPSELQVVLQQLADDAPAEYVCPISQCLMADTVLTSDGQCYDQPAILEWFATCQDASEDGTAGQVTSPLTNLPLESVGLTPNNALRERIQSYMTEQRAAKKQEQQRATAGEQPSSALARAGSGRGAAADDEEPSMRAVPLAAIDRQPDSAAAVSNLNRSRGGGGTNSRLGGEAEVEELGALRGEAPASPAKAAAPRGSGAPIWSSAVVPAGEENSRVLNLLRVHDGQLDVPASTGVAPLAVGASPTTGMNGRALGAERGRVSMLPASVAGHVGGRAEVRVPPRRAASAATLGSPKSSPSRDEDARSLLPPTSSSGAAAAPPPPAQQRRGADLYNFRPVMAPAAATGGGPNGAGAGGGAKTRDAVGRFVAPRPSAVPLVPAIAGVPRGVGGASSAAGAGGGARNLNNRRRA